jgi:cation diffusion facilitator CzcD-associated flavoprotein CzcO
MVESIQSKKVAVIGAGGAGLVAISELTKLGHQVTCFESESQIGGTWNYTNHRTSIYKNLRSNLPRTLMAFESFKFQPLPGSFSGDSREFPSHGEIMAYLEAYAEENELLGVI